MNPTSVGSFFSTTRNFYKYVVNNERKLTRVPPFEVALDYSPNSGKRIGILVEQGSTNHFPDSENLASSAIQKKNCTITNKSISGSTASALFPSGNSESWIGCNVSIPSEYVGVSFFVQQTSLQRPRFGYSGDEQATFTILINGKAVNVPMTDVDIQGPLNDLTYRVRLRCYVPGGQCNNIKIYKSNIHQHGLYISRIQFEPEMWTSYIPTNGTIQSRPAETVYRNLTHGIDVNGNQGTFDVIFTATPGSKGSAMTLLRNDWSSYVAVGHQRDENGDPEALRFHTDNTHIEVPLRYHNDSIRGRYAGVRFSYSGFGARGTVRDGDRVAKLKDFDAFKLGKVNRLHFGESYDGTHFTGHIHLINGYARVFDDEEMIDWTFVPNDGSLDPDFDLEESTVFSTAAAIFRTDEEALLYQNVVEPPTPQRILAAWPRTSNHYVAINPDNATGNGKRWYYDPVRDSFVQPVNSDQVEQILSPMKLSEFEFEATLNSKNADDDIIGLTVAASIIDGGLYSLTASINCGGNARAGVPRRFALMLQTPTTPSGVFRLGHFIAGSDFLPKVGGWSGKKVKVKITRQGTFVRAVASTWNGSDYDPSSELVCNMADFPEKAKMLGLQPARYGFLSNSQPDSTFLDYSLKSNQVINDLKIYSIESNKYWRFVGSSWVLQTTTASEDIAPSTRINNIRTKENFIVDKDTGELLFDRNNGIEYGTGVLSLPKNSTTDVLMSDLIDQFSLESGDLQFINLYKENNLIAEQIIVDGVQKLRIITNGTNGTFTLLLGTETVTDGFGITDDTIGFRKVNVVVQ